MGGWHHTASLPSPQPASRQSDLREFFNWFTAWSTASRKSWSVPLIPHDEDVCAVNLCHKSFPFSHPFLSFSVNKTSNTAYGAVLDLILYIWINLSPSLFLTQRHENSKTILKNKMLSLYVQAPKKIEMFQLQNNVWNQVWAERQLSFCRRIHS